MNDNAKDSVRPTSPLEHLVRRLNAGTPTTTTNGDHEGTWTITSKDVTKGEALMREAADEIERLREALTTAVAGLELTLAAVNHCSIPEARLHCKKSLVAISAVLTPNA